MPLYVPQAQFLGATTPLASSATTTPTLVFGPGWGKLFIYHFVAGYSGGGGIARIQFGTATTVDTGANYSNGSFRVTTTAANSQLVSSGAVNGFPIAASTSSTTNGRRGLHEVWNPSGNPKYIDSRTLTFTSTNPAAASAAHAAMEFVYGNWWQNSQAQCVAMDGGGSVNLLTGSYITVYGVPGQG